MPEGSHSALHQGPMGEGKTNAVNLILFVLVIADYEITSPVTWNFN